TPLSRGDRSAGNESIELSRYRGDHQCSNRHSDVPSVPGQATTDRSTRRPKVKAMIASIKDNDELQMNAYYDGELDPASAIEFERRLADNESLKVRYDRLLSLRRAVRSIPQFEVPRDLRARINSTLDADGPGADRPAQFTRQAPAGRQGRAVPWRQ